jgi:hypothetical protein
LAAHFVMDTPAKRRSLFGGLASSLFGRSQATTSDTTSETTSGTRPADSDRTSLQKEQVPMDSKPREEIYRKVDVSNTPSLPRVGHNASFESPAKRATASQLSSRRIIGRPQGPSSKLSQSVSASDFGTPKKTNFSSVASSSMNGIKPAGASMRMPGDNPNKFNTISGSTFSRPTRPTADFSGISGTATTPRNLFRASSAKGRPDFSFSPKVPYNTMKESFPPTTPGKPPRGSTADINGRSLVHANSSNLFEMRIPSPPRDLTGERLAKEVPEDKNRVASIYASEYLAHYCPPDFDDLQRRQFFCVLDLRRLKYAADEVFAKKDWKLNILNFAKEYEKSRSLIMLRYGLYEFKTVKASEAVKKQWKKDNNIPLSDGEEEEEEEEEVAPRKITNGQSAVGRGKRKAEEELVPKEVPKASNLNKRPVTERERERLDQASATSTPKSKRKADDLGEADDNPPSKLQKATPATSAHKASATKSIFEKIANGTPKESSNAAATSIFAKPKPSPANPFGTVQSTGKSILDQPSLAPSSNIFAHLSDTSKASSNDDADEESESEQDSTSGADGEAEESEAQGASPSDEASVAASGGVSTPQFGLFQGGLSAPKEAPVSSASSDAGGSTQGRSLFDRITRDKDGQPVRLGQKEATPQPTPSDNGKSATPPTDQSATPAPAPANKTWTTDTPIKFAPGPSQPSSLFGSAAPKPGSVFGAPSEAPKAAPAITLEPPTPAKVAEKPAVAAEESNPAATSQSIFGAKPATSSPFGATSAPSPSVFSTSSPAPSVFGSNSAASSLFGQTKPTEEKKSTDAPAPASSTSLFGAKPATPSPAPEASKPAASPLFGAQPAASEAPKPASTSLFGAKPAASEAETAKPASVFQSSSLFGNTAKATESKSPSSAPTAGFTFGAKAPETSTTPAATAGFSFGASTPSAPAAATSAQPLFGATAGQSSSLFGGPQAKPVESTSLFGSAPASGTSTPIPAFGAASASQNEPAKQPTSIFANAFGGNATPAPAESSFKFGASQSTVPSTSFGASASQPQQNNTQSGSIFGNVASGGSSFTFNAGGTQDQAASSFNNPFAGNGATSTPSSFNFGNTSNDNAAGQSSATPFSFGGGSAQAPSISFGAGSGTSTPTSTQPTNMFGGGANGGNSFGTTAGFSFGQSQPNGMFSAQQPAAPGGNMFAGGLAPMGGTSTGTSK